MSDSAGPQHPITPWLHWSVALLAVLLLVLGACTVFQQPSPSPSPSAGETGGSGIVHSGLIVSFFDAGQGDCILVQAPDGQTILVDGGGVGSGAAEFIRRQGVQRLNLVVATHPHADHIGGLPEVLGRFPVDEVWINGQEHTTATFENFLDAVEVSKARVHRARRGEVRQFGEIEVQVLHPGRTLVEDLNENSIVLLLSYRGAGFLFAGDIGRATEGRILASSAGLGAAVLKVGHHGSSGSSSEEFLRAVSPRIAVWMAGRDNDYGHPHRQTLERLEDIGAAVYGTAVDGTITTSTDGRRLRVSTAKTGKEAEFSLEGGGS